MISNIFSLIILIFSTHVFPVSEETTDDPHTILIPEDLDDESKMQYLGNQDVFDSTLKIIAQTPFKHTFSGSAVFLGRNKHRDIIAITNAHCLAPWVYNDRIIFPLSLVR